MLYLDAIANFYEAASNPELWPQALHSISQATGSRGALLTTPVFVPGGLSHSPDLKEAVGQFFDEAWYMRDMRTISVKDAHFRGGFFTDHTLFTDRQMADSEYYEKFARKADVPWFAAGRLKGDLSDGAVSISLQRSAEQGAFKAEDVSALNSLLPYLTPTMTLASRIAEGKGRALMEGLQLARQPAILLRESGAVAFVNEAAEKLLGKALLIRKNRLSCATTSENRRLQALISYACAAVRSPLESGFGSTPLALTSPDRHGRLIVTVAPIRRSGADVVSFAGVIVMIGDTSLKIELPQAAFRSIFDLTGREATIMALVGQGRTLRQIGSSLGLSHETVRHHLKSVLGKTNTGRQSELVALCLKIYPVIGQGELPTG